uniref:Uncharacterized protein n=1 Tax=Streptomyces sp. NBC_00008 TaxID=2903610 RepID=A0AAU2VZ43_9ACTN
MPDLSGPVFLTDPLRSVEPIPNFGCAICAALGRQRDEARTIGDVSTITDCSVEMRRHPHEGDHR